ncbi:hypothetical protein MKEN_01476000 [Mycena kentingensis (nom. inval.)]|nr:hypothetical protein MKEN_01476000 [Mycena kentingensis (nom. inval.)]
MLLATDSSSEIAYDTHYRSFFQLVWGCLVTIFACVWVSVHPNVPTPPPAYPTRADPDGGDPRPTKDVEAIATPTRSMFALRWRQLRWWAFDSRTMLHAKFKLMFMALIAPELIFAFAGRQFLVATYFSQHYKISRTHGFFISMGGFLGKDDRPLVTKSQLDKYSKSLKAIDEEEIVDRSKGDALSKGVALLQGLWFVFHCIARRLQNLPFTALEVTTVAFVAVNVSVYGLWWSKPLQVRCPMRLVPDEELPDTPDDVSVIRVGRRINHGSTGQKATLRVRLLLLVL